MPFDEAKNYDITPRETDNCLFLEDEINIIEKFIGVFTQTFPNPRVRHPINKIQA